MSEHGKKPRMSHWRKWTLAAVAAVGLTGSGLILTAPVVETDSTPPPPEMTSQIQKNVVERTEPLAKVFMASALNRQMAELVAGAEKNDINMIIGAISIGADISANNDLALRVATASGARDATRVFLDLGANPRANGGEPLENAVVNNDQSMVEFLLAHGADVHDNNEAALWWAVESGNVPIQKVLVERGGRISDDMLSMASQKKDSASFAFLAGARAQQDGQGPATSVPAP